MDLALEVGKFIEKESLFTKKDRLLVAVSGGVDSMVLLQVLHNQGYTLGIAHVNYKLRMNDSEQDYFLVQKHSNQLNLPLHVYPLSDKEKMELKRGNLQAKAREIRYRWFNELSQEFGYKYLCIAHHQDDQIETFFINASRGSGIKGLTSMKAKKASIRRPLLAFRKKDIEDYALSQRIPFRNDLSNFQNDYDRNFIRNEVITRIVERMPRAEMGLGTTLDILTDERKLFNHLIIKELDNWILENPEAIKVGPLTKMISFPGCRSLMHHILSSYDFNSADVDDILTNISKNGRIFKSISHVAEISNDFLWIKKESTSNKINYEISDEGQYKCNNGTLDIKKVEQSAFLKSDLIEFIDADKAPFPWIIRNVAEGDRFCPIGMHGRSKKLSDFMNELKIPNITKNDLMVITCQSEIIWVVGHRLDHRVRITASTKNIIKVQLVEESSSQSI